MRNAVALLSLLPSIALAVPLQVTHQGRLTNADSPVDQAQAEFVFKLWNSRNADDLGAQLVWESRTCKVDVRSGNYAVVLGSTDCNGATALDDTHLPIGTPRFLEVTFANTTLLPRLLVTPSPVATVAAVAKDADRLGGKEPGYYTDAAHLAGTLGAGVSYEGAPIADAQIASAARWDGKIGGLDAQAPLDASREGDGLTLTIAASGAGADGYLKGVDYARFDGKLGTAAAPLVTTGTEVSLPKASASADGYLGKSDFARFDAKLSGAAAPLVTTGTDVSLPKASASADGYLGKTDFARFDAKLDKTGGTLTGDLSLGGKLSLGGTGAIEGITRKPRAVLVQSFNAAATNWAAIGASGMVTAVDGRTTYAPGGVNATAAELAAGDFDAYVFDFDVWAVSDYNPELTISQLWRRFGRNVITIGNDTTATIYPIRETVSAGAAVYTQAGDPAAFHPITEDLRADTAPGANTDGVIYITRTASDFTTLFTVKGDPTRKMILVGESESGGIWVHDQTGFSFKDAGTVGSPGNKLLRRVLDYMTSGTARMAAARAHSRPTSLATDLKRSDKSYTWTELVANWTSNYYAVCGQGYHVCGLYEGMVRAYSGGARALQGGTYWTMGSISREGDSASTQSMVASWWSGTPNLNCTAGYHWVLPIYWDKAYAYHAPGCQADGTKSQAVCCADAY